MSQEQSKKSVSDEKKEAKGKSAENKPVDEKKAKKLETDLDKLIDEIDDILEENSEEFIKSYVQRGVE